MRLFTLTPFITSSISAIFLLIILGAFSLYSLLSFLIGSLSNPCILCLYFYWHFLVHAALLFSRSVWFIFIYNAVRDYIKCFLPFFHSKEFYHISPERPRTTWRYFSIFAFFFWGTVILCTTEFQCEWLGASSSETLWKHGHSVVLFLATGDILESKAPNPNNRTEPFPFLMKWQYFLLFK